MADKKSPRGSALKKGAVRPSPQSQGSVLTGYWKYIVLVTLLSGLWKLTSQRPPLLLLPHIPTNNNPTCAVHHEALLHGCEDFRRIPGSDFVVLSCDPGRRNWSHFTGDMQEGKQGEIFIWEYTKPETTPVRIEGPPGQTDFHPLGLSVIALPGEGEYTHRIFITNQRRETGQVEVFDINTKGGSRFVRSVRTPKIYSPNGIVAYSPTSFFVTNDMYFARKSALGVAAELLFGLPLTEVIYTSFDERSSDDLRVQAHTVVRIASGNGLEIDWTDRTLYVASMTYGISAYKLPIVAEGEVPLPVLPTAFFRTPFLPDNLYITDFPSLRTLYIAGVPSLGSFAKEMGDKAGKAKIAGSWVLKTSLGERGEEHPGRKLNAANMALRQEEWRFETAFSDRGELWGNAATGAVVSEGVFVAGSVSRAGMLVCKV